VHIKSAVNLERLTIVFKYLHHITSKKRQTKKVRMTMVWPKKNLH